MTNSLSVIDTAKRFCGAWFCECTRPPHSHAWCVIADQGNCSGKITQSSNLCLHQAQMAPGVAGCPELELLRKIRKMPAQHCRSPPPPAPGHWQSIQMEAFLKTPPRDQLANVLIPVLPPCRHLMYECIGAGEDDVVEERQAISVCPLKLVLWLFSVRSPPRDPRRGRCREPSSGKRPRSPKHVTLRLPSA